MCGIDRGFYFSSSAAREIQYVDGRFARRYKRRALGDATRRAANAFYIGARTGYLGHEFVLGNDFSSFVASFV